MLIADLHIHSKYSRATSTECDAPHLDFWARRKGISVLGTGDFTHPAWRSALHEALVPAQDGLYTLRSDLCLPGAVPGEAPRFVLSGEISSIYKKNGRVRKVHNVILLPGLEQADKLAERLAAIGNVHSDGRPILGLDSRDLLEITLDACPDAIFIPAHIWTPHFSLFGAFSGFDTVEECFEDLTGCIHAVETGLSSDPPMNWRVSALDRFTLVSNSDAHSPARLGREANLLDAPLSYADLKKAIETGEGFAGTLEFFPEEGKYHLDGHRSCGARLTPAQTQALGGRCPVCGKKITIGVEHRVEELADRPAGFRPAFAKPYESLVPLDQLIGACLGTGAQSKRVQSIYEALLAGLGSEFSILRDAPAEAVGHIAGPAVEEGLRRLRRGAVKREAGYDGVFGTLSLFEPGELEAFAGQTCLFAPSAASAPAPCTARAAAEPQPAASAAGSAAPDAQRAPGALNPEQACAVSAQDAAVAVIAGPGTGKTKTLTARIAWLLEHGVRAGDITAVTFTRAAAAEMRDRLAAMPSVKGRLRGLTVGTFHSICLGLLGSPALLSGAAALALAGEVLQALSLKTTPAKLLAAVSRFKNGLARPDDPADAVALYCERAAALGALDFDDLLLAELAREPGHTFPYLLVDEFQDIDALQYRLVRAWSRGGRSLFVIGDPDQSIYGFRGADSACFDRLRADLPALRVIRLQSNYRSTPQIIACALAAINAAGGETRALVPHCPDGAPVRLVHTDSERAEGIFIAREIARMTGGTDMLSAGPLEAARAEVRSFSDIAVLCRTYRQLLAVEDCLRHDGLPAIVCGRGDFLSDAAVCGALGLLRWLCTGECTELGAWLSFWRCPADLAQAVQKACAEGCGLPALCERFAGTDALAPLLAEAQALAGEAARERPRRFLEKWAAGHRLSRESAHAFGQLMDVAALHAGAAQLLDTLALGEEADIRRASGKAYAAGAVQLMTLHGAKGLEFPVVFLAGVSAGTLPYERPGRPCDAGEERRLFFVGITRAKAELVLLTGAQPSPFLADLPPALLCAQTAAPALREVQQLSLF